MRIEERALTLHEALEENCRAHPQKPFIYSHERTYTFEDVLRLSNGLAGYLRSLGLRKGDRACLLLPRVPEVVISFLGMSRVGVVPAPVNYTLSRAEVLRSLASVRPSLVVIHRKYVDLLGWAELAGKGVFIIIVGEEVAGAVPWEEACTPSHEGPKADIAFGEIAYLNYTTGSSGDPKGAIATHSNIYWNTRASVDAMEITGDDVHLIMFASFAHPHELFARALYTGGSTVLIEEINPKTIIRTINERSVSCMMGLAPMYDMISTHCTGKRVERLRVAESGGMYTRPDIIRKFKGHFGIPVLSVWGSTETTGIAIANTPSLYREDGSAGRACPYYDVEVLNDKGEKVSPGEVGELAFRGPGVISGYAGNGLLLRDGWYMSGDLGRQDEEGFFYFVERRSGMLKVAGLKVYPLQVELVLSTHEGIKEAAVVGMEDRLRGFVPKAYVVPREGHVLDPEEVRRFCKGRLADYMIPKQVEVIDELPKIGSGKVNKKLLR